MYRETAERMNSALNEVEKWNQMMFQAYKICLQGQKGSIQLHKMKRNQ